VAACIDTVLARGGRIDVVVNNAGYLLGGAVEEASLEQAKAQFETNFFGAFRVIKAILPIMRGQASGRIVMSPPSPGWCRCRLGVLQRQQVRARRIDGNAALRNEPVRDQGLGVERG